jgi:1,5-anhydro-D-fructose reductase (1,5-anhydro-D-mannitol-forming)
MNLGLIGASRIAARLLPTLRQVDGVYIAGVASADPVRAREFAAKSGMGAFASYDELLGDPGVDSVYVSVLNTDHTAVLERVMRACCLTG